MFDKWLKSHLNPSNKCSHPLSVAGKVGELIGMNASGAEHSFLSRVLLIPQLHYLWRHLKGEPPIYIPAHWRWVHAALKLSNDCRVASSRDEVPQLMLGWVIILP